MSDILLEIENLTVRRAGRTVLDIPALEIHAGEVLAVIGPNGAGKSTFLLALARLLSPDSGEIRFHGLPITPRDELAYRRKIGLVLQDALLLDDSVFNNVAVGLNFRRLPRSQVRQQVQHWLELLGIQDLAGRRARTLSGGEAQRASLARAFALQPELLLEISVDFNPRPVKLSSLKGILQNGRQEIANPLELHLASSSRRPLGPQKRQCCRY